MNNWKKLGPINVKELIKKSDFEIDEHWEIRKVERIVNNEKLVNEGLMD
jgi:hypothetical protein